VSEVSVLVALMPATLKRKSRLLPDFVRISATRNSRPDRESRLLTSHSTMWILECVLRASRSERSADLLRTPAMMVFVGLAESWRTNSKPMPRFAPVRKYVAILRGARVRPREDKALL